jgi:hypothetical protein
MKILIVLFTIFALFGCQEEPKPKPNQKNKIVNKEKISTKKTKKTQKVLPKWIDNPDLDGNIGAVGIVKVIQNKKKQKYIARKLAIASLMERKNVSVSNEYTSTTRKNKKDSTEKIEEKSDGFMVDEFIVKDEYTDGKNYYIWVVIKK